MHLIPKIKNIWKDINHPCIVYENKEIYFDEIFNSFTIDTSSIQSGDVVVLIGDFNPLSIYILIKLIDIGSIVVPLTNQNEEQHAYFFEVTEPDYIFKNGVLKKLHRNSRARNNLISHLKEKSKPGLILFTSGTSGSPKAILHDLSSFLAKFDTPRPPLRSISFLLFDHIGGINTLFHILFNTGVVIVPKKRDVESIIKLCDDYEVEALPTTPTFLRMLLMSGLITKKFPKSLKLITYGTELMDQFTLDELCQQLPNVDFRQTYGMSEIGILRVKSKNRNSLFMKIGGEGINTKVVDNVLFIKSKSSMLGYLNAESPFDSDGWYNTNDIVETDNEFIKVIGRTNELINVGGLKFMASEVESIALEFPNIRFAKVFVRKNPITGQHIELFIEPNHEKFREESLKEFLDKKLQTHMTPKRITIGKIQINHRYKKI